MPKTATDTQTIKAKPAAARTAAKKADAKKSTTTAAKKTAAKKTMAAKAASVKKTSPKTSVAKKSTAVKTTVRKTAASKTTAKKSTAAAAQTRKQTAVEKSLVKELTSLLPQLDEEGLSFLMEQANIHLYNMEVDRLNALHETEIATVSDSDHTTAAHQLSIVRGDSSDVYHIVCNGKYSMFNSNEMLSIIRICHADEELIEIKSRLYHWFFTERRDFLNDNALADIHCPEFDVLIDLIRERFTLTLPK